LGEEETSWGRVVVVESSTGLKQFKSREHSEEVKGVRNGPNQRKERTIDEDWEVTLAETEVMARLILPVIVFRARTD